MSVSPVPVSESVSQLLNHWGPQAQAPDGYRTSSSQLFCLFVYVLHSPPNPRPNPRPSPRLRLRSFRTISFALHGGRVRGGGRSTNPCFGGHIWVSCSSLSFTNAQSRAYSWKFLSFFDSSESCGFSFNCMLGRRFQSKVFVCCRDRKTLVAA